MYSHPFELLHVHLVWFKAFWRSTLSYSMSKGCKVIVCQSWRPKKYSTGWPIKIRSHYFGIRGSNLNFLAIFGLSAVKTNPCGCVSWKSNQNLDFFKVKNVLKPPIYQVNITLYWHFKLRRLTISKPGEVEKSYIPQKKALNNGTWK